MKFQVTILGSGSALPLPGRHPAAQIIATPSGLILMDCGEGTQFRMRELKVPFSKVKAICISHLHGDHYFGLLGLLNTYSLQGREDELCLIGPAGLDVILTEVLRQTESYFTYPLRFIPTQTDTPELVLEIDRLRIESFPLLHGVPTTGFKFVVAAEERKIKKELLSPEMSIEDIKHLKAGQDVYAASGEIKYAVEKYTYSPDAPKTYIYSSDTAYLPELATYFKGADLLYHEATFGAGLEERAMQTFHSTATQAATLARDSQVKRLLIGHLSSRYKDPQPILQEAQSIFAATEYAEEGDTFVV